MNLVNIKPTLLVLFLIAGIYGYTQYPKNVQAGLSMTKTNQKELIKALDYFYKTGDDLKIKSVNFLIANMPIHNSESYYWADNKGKRISFNELNYISYNAAITTVEQLKNKYAGLHPVSYSYRDIDSIKAAILIENINLAVDAYRQRKKTISEQDFLEYVLPYRVSVEPLQHWRKIYRDKYKNAFDKNQTANLQLVRLKQTIKNQFVSTWGQTKTEPLPRLGALQILFRGKGLCEDIADMGTFIARSQGIPAAVDNIPAWGTSTGNHFLNCIELDKEHPHFEFDGLLDTVLEREPAKVFRTTYSPQKDAIATRLDTSLIPAGFMRTKNYKDVTAEYWPASNITCNLYNAAANATVVYLCVFNNAIWQPVWYGLLQGKTATFTNMSKGVVYLPMVYQNKKLIPGGWPFALGYNNKAILAPDTIHKRSVTLPQQDKYLKYRSGKRYRLFYWNNQWKMLGEKVPSGNVTQLIFDEVPQHALLLLVPEYTQYKERPFIILDSGQRVWW